MVEIDLESNLFGGGDWVGFVRLLLEGTLTDRVNMRFECGIASLCGFTSLLSRGGVDVFSVGMQLARDGTIPLIEKESEACVVLEIGFRL